MSDSTELMLPTELSQLKALDINTLKAKEVGLNLLLLSLAEKQAQRIKKLSSALDKLEDFIFDESLFPHLSPAEQMQRYQLALTASQGSSVYIKDTIKSVNWDEIETRIMLLDKQSADGESSVGDVSASDLQAVALQLLTKLSQGN